MKKFAKNDKNVIYKHKLSQAIVVVVHFSYSQVKCKLMEFCATEHLCYTRYHAIIRADKKVVPRRSTGLAGDNGNGGIQNDKTIPNSSRVS